MTIIPFTRATATEAASCYSELAEMEGTLDYSGSPSGKGMQGICIPPAIKIPSSLKGTDYERYMTIACNAGDKDDYDTALINFKKALAEVPNGSKAQKEAARGYKAALLAKAAKNQPNNRSYILWPAITGRYSDGD